MIYGTTYDIYIYIYIEIYIEIKKIHSKLVYVGLAQARPNYSHVTSCLELMINFAEKTKLNYIDLVFGHLQASG